MEKFNQEQKDSSSEIVAETPFADVVARLEKIKPASFEQLEKESEMIEVLREVLERYKKELLLKLLSFHFLFPIVRN